MADPAPPRAEKHRDSGLWPVIKKRWRAWLRAIHRDVGYLAIGFTVIYAISGIAQNHIEDWGDVSYVATETTVAIPAIPDSTPDDEAIGRVVAAAKLGTPTAKLRAGDEIRLEYANGSKATLIGTQLTVQSRSRRVFIGAANWLHTARQKKGWKYVADAFAVFLLYLAISGIFMIKGKLGIKGRGAFLISIGVAVPITAVLFSSPAPKSTVASDDEPAEVAKPAAAPSSGSAAPAPSTGSAAPAPSTGSAAPAPTGSALAPEDNPGLKFLPPDDE